MSISLLSGSLSPAHWYHLQSDDGDTITYYLRNSNWQDDGRHSIKYVRSTLTWSDNLPAGYQGPNTFNNVDDALTSSFSGVVNPVTVYGYNYGSELWFSFTNPFYEPPSIYPLGDGSDLVSPELTYNFATNRLSWLIPASYYSTSDPLITAHRTDYLLDNDLWLPNTVGYTTYIFHTKGTPSIGNSSNDIIPGTWRIRRKISAPSGMTTILASITITQIEIDAYNAAAAAQAAADAAAAQAAADAAAAAQAAADAAAAAQAAADAAAAGSNAPPNTPRRRRGNHNFW